MGNHKISDLQVTDKKQRHIMNARFLIMRYARRNTNNKKVICFFLREVTDKEGINEYICNNLNKEKKKAEANDVRPK